MRRRLAALLVLLPLAGCGLATSLAVDLVYRDAVLPDALVARDVPYLPDGDPKHRLTLFRAAPDSVGAHPAPTVVFVHGGGWTTGDRDLRVGGEDVYNNIGRFLAARGIPSATISYRLLGPDRASVTWREQVADAAAAVAFVQRATAPAGVVVMGHSAGAHLATFVALDADVQRAAGAAPVCGAVSVSGAALDLRDRETFALEGNFDYYSSRFAPDRVARREPPATPAPWQAEASPLTRVTPGAPPFLILYAGGETRALQRQSRLLDEALRAAGVPSRLVVVPGRSHTRIVPTLSRDDQTAGPAILDFVRGLDCAGHGSTARLSWLAARHTRRGGHARPMLDRPPEPGYPGQVEARDLSRDGSARFNDEAVLRQPDAGPRARRLRGDRRWGVGALRLRPAAVSAR